ncbi:DUF2240 family protein [Haloarculaceae archaeon H-GB2-1]|nr:DUF2240 family protein [Haloarculaceae archaeon H-GB1-1]MEA5407830.1 DUF2240 family protein [Haloarculaceae archaeon H-GB2-1]
MTLRTAVAVPFQQSGRDTMDESEFVVALSLDRDWFSPDQAKRLVDVAASEGLLDRDADDLQITFDPSGVSVPDDFAPDESLLQERTTFERVLGALVEEGVEKQTAVAAINSLQTDLGVTVEAAAVVYANGQGIDVSDLADRALSEV